MEKLEMLGVTDLIDIYKSKALSPVEYVNYMLGRIEKEELNSFVTITQEEAIKAAKLAEQDYVNGTEKALSGVLIGVKDIIDVKGYPTTCTSKAHINDIASEDAFVIKKLKEAGGCISGKMNTSQYAVGPTGEFSHIGPCKNPHDHTKISGGSSSGSAASVAGFLQPAAIGTDTGGSIRIPSSLCGAVGMKPTFTRISKAGVFNLSAVLDSVGPITRSVKDNAYLLNAMQGHNPYEWYSCRNDSEDFTRWIGKSIKGKKIAYIKEFFEDEDIDEEGRKLLDEALKVFQRQGAIVEEMELGDTSVFRTAHQRIIFASAWYALREDIKKDKDAIFQQVWQRALNGNVMSTEYLDYSDLREKFYGMMMKKTAEYDVVLLPASPTTATSIGVLEEEVNGRRKEILTTHPKFTWLCNFTGFPAISIPIGKKRNRLPMGLSLFAKPFEEAKVYQYAYSLERELDYDYSLD